MQLIFGGGGGLTEDEAGTAQWGLCKAGCNAKKFLTMCAQCCPRVAK